MIEMGDTKSGAGEAATGASTSADVAAAATSSRETQTASASFVKPLLVHRGSRTSSKDHYHVEELLQYHDRQFIEQVYRAILRRSPSDAEGARDLDELRSGRESKVEIIERVWSSAEAQSGDGAAGRVRLEGLPSPLMRRLTGVPVVGYLLRVLRALVRLPVLMQHQQQFEVYALAQQQIIADHVNQLSASAVAGDVAAAEGDASRPVVHLSHSSDDVIETVEMFSDALLDLSNGHAELQAHVQTQTEQTQAALADLTQAVTAQQQITETLRREQQSAFDAQQEFLIQEQRVIVETQKAVLEELREELRALSERQRSAHEELYTEVRRLQSLLDAASATRTPTSDQA
ncbi:MAG TPA: hypothetical protein VJ842_17900 [Pyrinomonadaceae bacterium]|nr:hypothetical protein [Pyrinomonadaceae bacterium]